MAKILIVDDSKVVRMQVCQILQDLGHEVLEAEDGEMGLDIAQQHSDFDLILSDYNMPGMDGLKMLEMITETTENRNSFYGLLTTESSPSLKAKGKAIGVGVWIVKPVDNKKLIKITETIFSR